MNSICLSSFERRISLYEDWWLFQDTTRELKDLALGNNLIHISNKQDTDGYTEQAADMALNKNLIDPLLEWKFITVNKQGAHHIVSVTDEGRNALKFLNVD